MEVDLWYTYRAMRKLIMTLAAMFAFAHMASGDVVRQRSVPAATCGEQSLTPGARLVLPTFDGAEVSLVLGRRTSSVTGFSSYGAKTDGAVGWNATVVETADGFVATVPDSRTGFVYTFRRTAESLAIAERAPACGPLRACEPKQVVDESSSGFRTKKASLPPLTGNPLVDGKAMLKGEHLTNVVDVLIAYDKSAADWVRKNTVFAAASNPLAAFAQDRVQDMNNTLANSGLGQLFEFRLAGVIAVATDATKLKDKRGDVDLGRALDYVSGYATDPNATRRADWKKIRAKREAVGADLVSLLVDAGKSGMVGFGFALDNGSIRSARFCDYAYSACSIYGAAYGHSI